MTYREVITRLRFHLSLPTRLLLLMVFLRHDGNVKAISRCQEKQKNDNFDIQMELNVNKVPLVSHIDKPLPFICLQLTTFLIEIPFRNETCRNTVQEPIYMKNEL